MHSLELMFQLPHNLILLLQVVAAIIALGN